MRKTGNSKVTNGHCLFIEGVDGRSVYARRYRDLYKGFLSDVAVNGEDEEAQRQLCRRASALCVQAEGMEAELARGEDIDMDQYCSLTKTMLRVFKTLGMSAEGDNKDSVNPNDSLDRWLEREGIETIEG